ncbi:TPA: murein transglycosylase A [Proteus mirabilis]
MVTWRKSLLLGILALALTGCHRPTDQGQQYKDGKLKQDLIEVNSPNTQGKPINVSDYLEQINQINQTSSRLYNSNQDTYQAVENWLRSGADTRQLRQFNIAAFQMEGEDNYGNVKFTGYYTPVLEARLTPQGDFKYPLYRMPAKVRGKLPSRAAIYNGALSPTLIAAYSNSIMDNFMMEVQGSGYVDYGDGKPLTFFGYAGKNGHPYRSIGKVLIDNGEVEKEAMSMLAIREWADKHSEQEVRKLLEQNPSFVFFKPEPFTPVRGASAIPLIAKASVASDRSIIPAGTVLLAEIPILDNTGKFTGQYQMRLMVALDVGGAIKGHHFDIYHGIGKEAGQMAGFYNHYGRVWVLKKSQPTLLNPIQ